MNGRATGIAILAGGMTLVFGLGATRVSPSGATRVDNKTLSTIVARYCAASCHSQKQLKGNLNLEGYSVDSAPGRLATSEKMIRKLRAQIMPPPGAKRPAGDTLIALAEALEQTIDAAAGSHPNPGTRTFQRLNRAEYERAVHDLLDVDINAGDYLPLDTKSANFDNIADAQALSPTLLEAYLNAAAAVTRLAMGDAKATPAITTFSQSPFVSQHPWDHVDGAPYGTRGGIVATHVFPADGLYSLRIEVRGGLGTRLEDIDVSIDGSRVALVHYEKGVERSLSSADAPQGADYVRTEPLAIRAGEQRVSVAFVRRTEGPYEDLIKPTDWSLASNGTNSSGTTLQPHIMELTIVGPQKTTGLSETPSRRTIFSCYPKAAPGARACASQIVSRLGTRAYRKPLTKHDVDGLMRFFDAEYSKPGDEFRARFENGVGAAIQAMLASPHFVFRIEEAPAHVEAGRDYRLSDFDVASRLSFFLWGTIPDQQLLTLASHHQLSNDKLLEAQVRRMLADPRADALSTRFAAQWLRLQDLDKVRPDAFWYPDYDQQLADAMREETQRFFGDLVHRDASILEMLTANYTYVNDRLARHYGFANISGPEFRRVVYPDSTRRGLLGQGAILVQTSHANRTSPVLRGKWVMEVLIGMPPPPPPPNVPDLEETVASKEGRQLTTRERMEIHRANAQCKTCHQYMDPIGLALDNFDVTGKWRYRENGAALDTRGTMYDGSAVQTPDDLTRALLKRPLPLVRAFTENLMAYGIGRRVEDFDQPTIRAIVRDAEPGNYRISSLILGVVKSPAFRMKRADAAVQADEQQK